MKKGTKKVFCLRHRENDECAWSLPVFYKSGKNRDKDASMDRIVGGMRTQSYEETVAKEKYELLYFIDAL